MDVDIRSLHPLEIKVLLNFSAAASLSVPEMVERLGLKEGQGNQVVSWLQAKDLIEEAARTARVLYELTELGHDFATRGSPEERVLRSLQDHGPTPLPALAEACGLEMRDIGSAFGALSKAGAVKMDADKRAELVDAAHAEWVPVVRGLLDRATSEGILADETLSEAERAAMQGIAKKRGAGSVAFRIVERSDVTYRFTDAGRSAREAVSKAGLTGDEVGSLTPAMLRDGSWKQATFRSYNIDTPPARLIPGRRNPYAEYLESVKDTLVGLGFEEFDGPIVENEFWNSDALFMPQFHAARDIHDVYYVAEPTHAREIEQPYLDQVAAAHENGWNTGSRGWNYSFDRDFTRRLILRSQGTVLSAKQLPKAKVPGRYFGIVRCFRYDQVDATHLSDFYQTEGIVLGEDVNLRTLLGMLKMFAEEVAGATEVKYVPGYFPFTEPSVEVHIKHPKLGWFELGGSGIFRPEVTAPLGIDVPVLAWGLGIDRMALMHLGLNDLRELFSNDLERVRLRRRK
ncbi:MAG: phenylalanine--tRNA ligase subunit alpha [Spirochaetota bacterium]